MQGADDATGAGLAPEVVQDLDAITVPVLVMDGGDSRSTMRTCADAIAAHLSHGRRRTPAGHGERLVRLGTRLVARFPLVPVRST